MLLQADAGAQVVQIFDSWAAHLAPRDFDIFAGPYIKQIVDSVKATHPDLPLILYISGSGGLLERMAATGVDIISVDGSVDMPQAIQRCGRHLAYQVNIPEPPAWRFVLRWKVRVFENQIGTMQTVLGLDLAEAMPMSALMLVA